MFLKNEDVEILTMAIERSGNKILAWLKISRLHFYPLPLLVYSLGAVGFHSLSGEFNSGVYVLGLVYIFLVELCSVLANEYFDFMTDSLNKNPGPFNGGSRVLVEGGLDFREVRTAIFILLLSIFSTGFILFKIASGARPLSILSLLSTGVFFGLGYTLPPIKFSYRGMGEVVVAVTFGPYLILCGYIFQGGAWKDPWPWLVSLPLFFAIFCAITLSGVPDFHADHAAKKRTLAVIFGQRTAVILSVCGVSAAATAWIALFYFKIMSGWLWVSIPLVLVHFSFLLAVLFKLVRSDRFDRKIDREMALTLSYMVWFGLVPFISSVL